MNDELLNSIEREVLGWPGVSKETGGGGPGQGGFWVPPATVYRFGRRQIGHVHHGDDGLADFSFPREVRDELMRSGRAIPHPAFPDSRTTASYRVRSGGVLLVRFPDVLRVIDVGDLHAVPARCG
jgi:hypothetical protein